MVGQKGCRYCSATLLLAFFVFSCSSGKRPPVSPKVSPKASAKAPSDAPGQAFRQHIRRWQKTRRAKLLSRGGWVSLSGLHWLQKGPNRIGSAKENEIVLGDHAPPLLATLSLEGKILRWRTEKNVEVLSAGKRIEQLDLRSDADPKGPHRLESSSFSFMVIVRGSRLALRIFDYQAKTRRDFGPLKYFPADADWRIVATFEPHERKKTLKVDTVIGTREEIQSPGIVRFRRGEKRFELTASYGNEEGVFIHFADTTNGSETYGGGRFLWAPFVGERVILDFNQAYNPPCAFTLYATCPVPLPRNRLSRTVKAGEKTYETP